VETNEGEMARPPTVRSWH